MSTKAKILFLLDFFPFPENRDGLNKIMANTINRLDDKFDITLLILNGRVKDIDSVKKKVTIFQVNHKLSKIQKRINQLSFRPLNALSLNTLKEFDLEFNFKQYQIIHTALHSFVRLSEIYDNVIYGLNDSLSITCLNDTLKGKLKFLYFRIVEYRLSTMSHTITIVSQKDADSYYNNNYLVLPIGVNTNEYQLNLGLNKINNFVFHGVLDYHVNMDSIKLISKFLADASKTYKLSLIGRINEQNPSEIIKEYQKLNNCDFIGEVENIATEIPKYQFYIALMNSGAGVKNKIIEAMSCGMLVIVNERAIEGFSHQEELLKSVYVINQPSDITTIVNNNNDWNLKSCNAREFVKKHYSWESYMNILEKKYLEFI